MSRLSEDLDDDEVEGSGKYSGTFRWKSSKRLPQLPPLKKESVESGESLKTASIDIQHGWGEYFRTRGVVSDLPSGELLPLQDTVKLF